MSVVPFVGTWIEIAMKMKVQMKQEVVPFVGTWIEIETELRIGGVARCRTLRGYVD